MFGDIKVPFDSVMLYNVAKLKEGITISDVEEHLGTMCNIVKNKYKGFLAGQVFEYAGFVSKEGSVGDLGPEGNHIAIITYWTSFDDYVDWYADIINKAWSKLNKDGWMYCHNNFIGNALVMSKIDKKIREKFRTFF